MSSMTAFRLIRLPFRFIEGFRTPATVQAASSRSAGIRNPHQTRLGPPDSRFGHVGFPLIAIDFSGASNFAMCHRGDMCNVRVARVGSLPDPAFQEAGHDKGHKAVGRFVPQCQPILSFHCGSQSSPLRASRRLRSDPKPRRAIRFTAGPASRPPRTVAPIANALVAGEAMANISVR